MPVHAPETAIDLRRHFVVTVLVAIGLFDLCSGARLLTHPTPWLLNWQERPWMALPAQWRDSVETQTLALGLYRRIGAFWLHAGAVTVAWAWLSRRHRLGLSVLLATYSVTGMGIAYCDNTFAAGTTWQSMKQAVGACWVLALLLHFSEYWRPPRSGAAPTAEA